MRAYIELYSWSLLYYYKITKLLRKKIKDEGKVKMTNKLVGLKCQSVVDKEALEAMRKELDIMKEEMVEMHKRYKSWRNCYLKSEKKGKEKVEELNASLAKEKNVGKDLCSHTIIVVS